MRTDITSSQSKPISSAISRVLEEGSVAVLVTLINSPDESNLARGAKLLVDESSNQTGGLGDSELANAVARQAQKFLASRREAETFKVEAFAPELKQYAGA